MPATFPTPNSAPAPGPAGRATVSPSPPSSVLSDPSRPIPDAARLPVALIHGLYTRGLIFWPLGRALARDQRPPLYFDYPSRFRDIPDNALRLARWFQTQGPGPFDVVTHSLGAIVLRWAATHHDLPRLRRVVMIAPPNRGSILADTLCRKLGPLYRLVYGRTGLQLRRGGRGLAQDAGLPKAQIGVIAGGVGSPKGYSRFVPGDNDMTVAVEETILGGMKDFVLLQHRHSPLVWSRDTAEYVVRFLKTGRFRVPTTVETDPGGPGGG